MPIKTNPIQTQFKPNSKPIQTQFKANSNPIKPNFPPTPPKISPKTTPNALSPYGLRAKTATLILAKYQDASLFLTRPITNHATQTISAAPLQTDHTRRPAPAIYVFTYC